MRLGTWLAQREGKDAINKMALEGINEEKLEEKYLQHNIDTWDTGVKVVKIVQKGEMVWKPFVVIWQASPNSHYQDQARFEVCANLKYSLLGLILVLKCMLQVPGLLKDEGSFKLPYQDQAMVKVCARLSFHD